ncbi:MAG: hypothetical protein WC389_22230 [Lutibacter sp.]|jgi:hypothetical protein
MKANIRFIEYGNDGSEKELIFDSLSRALLVMDENKNIQMVISDSDSTGEVMIQFGNSSPEVFAYNF